MSGLLERAQAVKARWDIRSLWTILTDEPVPASGKVRSLDHEDNDPSLMLYTEGNFYDYSTGKHGDIFDLIRMFKRCSFSDAVDFLEQEADDLRLAVVDRPAAVKQPFVMPMQNMALDTPSPLPGVSSKHWDYLWSHGRLGWFMNAPGIESSIGVVHYEWCTAYPIGVKYRYHDGGKGAQPGSEFTKNLYWTGWGGECPAAVILEGESDLWAWESAAPQAHSERQLFALPSGASAWKDSWLEQLEPYSKIYLAFDNDEAGKRATDKVALKVGYGRAEFVRLPGAYNDVREAVSKGWKPPAIG